MESISPSRILSYLRCGESYRRRFLDNEIIPPSIALHKGKATHKGIEKNNVYKKETKEDMKLKEVLEIISNEYDQNIKKEGLLLNKEEETIGKDKIVGEGKDTIISLGRLYREEVAPDIMPLYVEEKVIIQTSQQVELVSVLDLCDDKKNIIDFKTSNRKKNESEISSDLQLSFQALTFRSLTKENPNSVNFCVLIEKKQPEVQNLKGTRTEVEYKILLNYINIYLKGIRNGVFMPPNPTITYYCNPKWCGYFNTCDFTKH